MFHYHHPMEKSKGLSCLAGILRRKHSCEFFQVPTSHQDRNLKAGEFLIGPSILAISHKNRPLQGPFDYILMNLVKNDDICKVWKKRESAACVAANAVFQVCFFI